MTKRNQIPVLPFPVMQSRGRMISRSGRRKNHGKRKNPSIVDGTVEVQGEERHDNREEKNDPIYMSELDKYADCIWLVSATPPKWQAEWLRAHP